MKRQKDFLKNGYGPNFFKKEDFLKNDFWNLHQWIPREKLYQTQLSPKVSSFFFPQPDNSKQTNQGFVNQNYYIPY